MTQAPGSFPSLSALLCSSQDRTGGQSLSPSEASPTIALWLLKLLRLEQPPWGPGQSHLPHQPGGPQGSSEPREGAQVPHVLPQHQPRGTVRAPECPRDALTVWAAPGNWHKRAQPWPPADLPGGCALHHSCWGVCIRAVGPLCPSRFSSD